MPLFGRPNIEKLKQKRDIDGLIKALSHKDAEIRAEAAEALWLLEDALPVEPFVTALGDSDSRVRRMAVFVLGNLGDARALEPLVTILKDEYKDVHVAAAVALAELGDMRAVPPLIASLEDVDRFVRDHAARWRARSTDRLNEFCSATGAHLFCQLEEHGRPTYRSRSSRRCWLTAGGEIVGGSQWVVASDPGDWHGRPR